MHCRHCTATLQRCNKDRSAGWRSKKDAAQRRRAEGRVRRCAAVIGGLTPRRAPWDFFTPTDTSAPAGIGENRDDLVGGHPTLARPRTEARGVSGMLFIPRPPHERGKQIPIMPGQARAGIPQARRLSRAFVSPPIGTGVDRPAADGILSLQRVVRTSHMAKRERGPGRRLSGDAERRGHVCRSLAPVTWPECVCAHLTPPHDAGRSLTFPARQGEGGFLCSVDLTQRDFATFHGGRDAA